MSPLRGIITFVLCYELISMIMEKQYARYGYVYVFQIHFKMWVAVYLVTHTFDIAMAIFDVANHVSNAGGMITVPHLLMLQKH